MDKHAKINEKIETLRPLFEAKLNTVAPLMEYLKSKVNEYDQRNPDDKILILGSTGNNLYFPETDDVGTFTVEVDILFERDASDLTFPIEFGKGPKVALEEAPALKYGSADDDAYIWLKATQVDVDEEIWRDHFLNYDATEDAYYMKNLVYRDAIPSRTEEVFGETILGEKELLILRMESEGGQPFRTFKTTLQSVELKTQGKTETFQYLCLFDKVAGIKIPWPSAAQEWVTRKRRWPPKSLIEEAEAYGCHAIPKAANKRDPLIHGEPVDSEEENSIHGEQEPVDSKEENSGAPSSFFPSSGMYYLWSVLGGSILKLFRLFTSGFHRGFAVFRGLHRLDESGHGKDELGSENVECSRETVSSELSCGEQDDAECPNLDSDEGQSPRDSNEIEKVELSNLNQNLEEQKFDFENYDSFDFGLGSELRSRGFPATDSQRQGEDTELSSQIEEDRKDMKEEQSESDLDGNRETSGLHLVGFDTPGLNLSGDESEQTCEVDRNSCDLQQDGLEQQSKFIGCDPESSDAPSSECGAEVADTPSEDPERVRSWKLSYAWAEQKIARAFTPTQRYAYLMLKQIKREHLDEAKINEDLILSSGLTTYHLKTAMFWVCEQITPEEWEENPARGLLAVLEFLLNGFTEGFLPNYFTPKVNGLDRVWRNAAYVYRDEDQLRNFRFQPIIKLLTETIETLEEKLDLTLLLSCDQSHVDSTQSKLLADGPFGSMMGIHKDFVERNKEMDKLWESVMGEKPSKL